MKLPRRITPCPIIESIIELRFSLNVPDDAIFGLVHKEIKDTFVDVQKLPILNLPEPVRRNETNLRFKPYYKFSNKEFDMNLGPRVVSIIKKEPYDGWEKFLNKTRDIFDKLNKLEIINDPERLGIRYTNFFAEDIYDKIDLELTLNNASFIKEDTYIKNTYYESGHRVILQLGNSSTLEKGNERKEGSVLDVDVLLEDLPSNFFENSNKILNKAHQLEKKTFFKLLNEDFIKSLNPQF